MRILLILFFILVADNAFAKRVGGKTICEGFCKNEKYVYAAGFHKVPYNVVVNGKKKKLKFQVLNKSVNVENSWCKPFRSITLFEPKSRNTDKILERIRESFYINICLPCPPGIKKTSSGYCPLGTYIYEKIYEKAFHFGLYEKVKFFNDFEIKEKGLALELLAFSISNRKDLFFMKYFSKSENKVLYKFFTHEYKTPFKQQVVKTSIIYDLKEKKFKNLIDDFTKRIENSWDIEEGSDLEKLYKSLYSSLLTNEEIDLLINTFSVLRDLHIQTRN